MLAFQPEVRRKQTLASLLKSLNAGVDADPVSLAKHLGEIAERGYDVTADKATEITGVAAPVFDGDGACVASIAIAVPTSRFDATKEAAMVEEVVTAGDGLSRALKESRRKSAIS